jgi:hypothetical protein
MPTYPGSPQLTVDALLRTPQLIARTLTSLVSKRFVADQIFTRGTPEQVAGGTMMYERSENIFPDRGGSNVAAEEVGVRSEWPRAGWTEAVLSAIVRKYGLESPISFESIRRNRLDQLARAERKLANAVTKFVDTQAMSLLTSDAAVGTTTAGATWTAGATTIISDLANAQKSIRDADEGYEADVCILNPAQYLFLLTNTDLRSALPREGGAPEAPIVTGRAAPILGLRFLESPQLSAGTVLVGASKLVGTIADEQPDAIEGYVSYDLNSSVGNASAAGGSGIQMITQGPAPNPNYPSDFAPVYVKVFEQPGRDEKIVRAARFPAMAILEPKSFFKITSA